MSRNVQKCPKMSRDQMSGDQTSGDQTSGDQMSRDQMSGDQIGMEIICECAAGDQTRMKIERPRSNVRDRMSGDQSFGDQMRTTRRYMKIVKAKKH